MNAFTLFQSRVFRLRRSTAESVIAALVIAAALNTALFAQGEDSAWLKRRSGLTTDGHAVTFTGSAFVAAGAKGRVSVSQDGISWRSMATPVKSNLNAVGHIKNTVVAAADKGELAVSKDGGKTWTKQQLEFAPNHILTMNMYAVTASDNRCLVAGESGVMMTSRGDLETWELAHVETNKNLRGLTYAKVDYIDDGVWVAVGDENTFCYSFDAVHWNKADVDLPGVHDFHSVAFSQNRFVAVASDGFVARSQYGEDDWEGEIVPELAGARSVAGGMDRFVVVTESGGVASSPDGRDWRMEDESFGGLGVAFGGDSFVCVGARGAFFQSPPLFSPRSGGSGDHPGTLFDEGQPVAPLISLPRFSINTSSLDLVLEGVLFRMNTSGLPILGSWVFNRQPGDDEPGMFGVGWRFSFESDIKVSENAATLTRGSGAKVVFRNPGDETATPSSPVVWNAPDGMFDTLTCYGAYWELQEKASKAIWRYDQANPEHPARLTLITDQNQNKIVIVVNQESGLISEIRDSTGGDARVIQFSNVGGRCQAIQLPDSRSLEFVITGQHGSDRLISIRDMAGYRAFYSYDRDGYITQISNQTLPNIIIQYVARPTGEGKIIRYVQEGQRQTSYELVAGSYGQVERRDSTGKTTLLIAKDGRTTRIVDPLGQVRSVDYLNRMPVRFVEPSGATTQWEYDHRGNPLKVTDALGHTTTMTYDWRDNLLTRRDALDRTWSYQYDAASNLTRIISPLGHLTRFFYDAKGRLQNVLDPRNHLTTLGYDDYGNLTSFTNPLSQTTQFHYAAQGMLCTGITDARGQLKQITLDGNERLVRTLYSSAPGTPDLAFHFDAFWQKSQTDELGRMTSVERNLHGFITRRTSPMGHVRSTEYDADDRPVAKTDELGRVSQVIYDDNGRPIRSVAPDGGAIERKYDADGRLVSVKDAAGSFTWLYYDKAGRVVGVRHPDQSLIQYDRDPLGRISRLTNARRQEVFYDYDADGRMVSVKHGDTTVAAYQYDAAGNVIRMTDANGSHTYYTFDAANRLTLVAESESGKEIGFTYDPTGNISRITYPDGTVLDYTHDTFNRVPIPASLAASSAGTGKERSNRVLSMSWNGGRISTFSYDSSSRLLTENHANGLIGAYGYDADDRLIAHALTGPSGALSTAELAYDAASQIVMQDLDHPVAPPLPGAAKASYDRSNKLIKWNGAKVKSDLDGNVIDSGDDRFQASYDEQNRLLSLAASGETLQFTHNALGLRATKSAGGVTTRYCYDPAGRLLFEWTGDAVSNQLYLGDRLYATGSLATGFRYLHPDRQGNIIAVSDDGGNVAEAVAYDPYGRLVTASGSDLAGPSYVGAYGVRHDGAGLYHMQRRQYDATAGRFLQRDPIGFQGGVNLFAYANGNPVNRIDPQGTVDIWGLTKFLRGSSKDIQRLDKKQRAIEEMGILNAVENGSFQEERKNRGDTVVNRGREGAKVALQTTLNAVPGQPSILTPAGAAWSSVKRKMGEVGPIEVVDSGSSRAPSPPSRGDIPIDESGSGNGPIIIEDDTDWSEIKDPTEP